MKKYKLKSLIKFILKEVLENTPITTTKLLDNWKEVSTVKCGRMAGTRGYFIMKNGKLADASSEMEGSTGQGGGVDHYGYALALDNRKLFGVPDDLADKLLRYRTDDTVYGDDFEYQNDYFKLWGYIEKAILARVMTMVRTSNTHKPDITIQMFNKSLSPKSALRFAKKNGRRKY